MRYDAACPVANGHRRRGGAGLKAWATAVSKRHAQCCHIELARKPAPARPLLVADVDGDGGACGSRLCFALDAVCDDDFWIWTWCCAVKVWARARRGIWFRAAIVYRARISPAIPLLLLIRIVRMVVVVGPLGLVTRLDAPPRRTIWAPGHAGMLGGHRAAVPSVAVTRLVRGFDRDP